MKASLFLTALAVGSFAAMPCLANSLDPDLAFTGYATVGSNFIDFNSSPTGSGTAVTPPGYGTFSITGTPSGVFTGTGLAAGDTGDIESLSTTTPVVQPFIKFTTSSVVLDLTAVNPGTTIGPFNLADTPSGATASFSVNGTVVNGSTSTPYLGVFSATFAGTSVATLLAEEAAGMNISTSFSGTITSMPSTVPEPASLALLGLGLLGVGAFARKKVRHS